MFILAKILNLFYALGLTFPAVIIFAIEKYFRKNPGGLGIFLTYISPEVLWKIAEQKLLYVVKRQIKTTPALQRVKQEYFPRHDIKSLKDFHEFFPILDKENYIRKYGLKDLCQGGRLPHAGGFYKSAGTSGSVTLYAESIDEELLFDEVVSLIGELIFQVDSEDYVILNCWALGSWPTGINFSSSVRYKGKVVNVGVNIEEAIYILKTLGPEYKFLLAGYPPFIYRLIETAKDRGVDWRKYSLDIVSGGEGFVEAWRDDILSDIGNKKIVSVYGSTDKDLGEGLETPLAYLVRSLLHVSSLVLLDETKAREIMKLRFNSGKLPFTQESARQFLFDFMGQDEKILRIPMVFQFDPSRHYSENLARLEPEKSQEITEFATTVLWPQATMPRIRYNIHDEGFIMKYEAVKLILDKYSINVHDFNYRGDKYLDLHLPFLFIFGRSEGVVALDGAKIYPEEVEKCLRSDEVLFKMINSFQLFVSEDYRLGIAIELAGAEAISEEKKHNITETIKRGLVRYSFGYRELLHDQLPSANFIVTLYEFSKGPFADRNLKLKYVRH